MRMIAFGDKRGFENQKLCRALQTTGGYAEPSHTAPVIEEMNQVLPFAWVWGSGEEGGEGDSVGPIESSPAPLNQLTRLKHFPKIAPRLIKGVTTTVDSTGSGTVSPYFLSSQVTSWK